MSPSYPADTRLHLTVLVLSAGSCSLPLALVPVPGVQTSVFGRWIVSLLGPAAGWIPAVASHQVPQALGFLLTATVACAMPLGIYVATRHPGWLCVAAVVWVVTGWFLGVAIWV